MPYFSPSLLHYFQTPLFCIFILLVVPLFYHSFPLHPSTPRTIFLPCSFPLLTFLPHMSTILKLASSIPIFSSLSSFPINISLHTLTSFDLSSLTIFHFWVSYISTSLLIALQFSLLYTSRLGFSLSLHYQVNASLYLLCLDFLLCYLCVLLRWLKGRCPNLDFLFMR